MLHFYERQIDIVRIDPDTGDESVHSSFRPPRNVLLAKIDRMGPQNRSQFSPNLEWVVVKVNPGANPGYMNISGTVVDPAELLAPSSDFGYERQVSAGQFGKDGRYYFFTKEGDDKKFWAIDPDTEKPVELTRDEVQDSVGGYTGLTREGMSGDEDAWIVPGRSGTTCSRALDIRSGQCLFGTSLDQSDEGRLEIWKLADDTAVSFFPGTEKEATAVVSLVPPNDKGYASAKFSPNGRQVAFMTATEETMSNTIGELYLVGTGDKNPKKLSDERYNIESPEESWVVFDWR